MVTQWTVLSNLRQITSLDGEGAAFGLSLCLTCLEEIRARLRDGADENDSSIERAAAGLAFYKLTLRRLSEDSSTSFKAGDVSVSQNPGELLAIAAKVREEALAEAAPLLKDELFLFKRVDV
ncbi:MAG: hypothetical protein WCN92_03770 [Eubacteriales bacterium]